MTRFMPLYMVPVAAVVLLSACGESRSASDLIVGEWEAENRGETMHIEFRSDGVALQEGQPEQRYLVVDGDPDTLRILEMGGDDVIIELEMVFDGEDNFTLSGRGMTAYLTRIR